MQQSKDVTRRTLKTSEVVALEIVRDIVSQSLKPGDRLPLESEMLVQYRVSRSSLREALRLLEVQGLIAIRPGPGAGTVVGRVLPSNLARTLTLHMHMMGADYSQLLDAWVSAEPLQARLAAENPNRKRVKDLLSPFIEPKSEKRTYMAGHTFHDLVAELANRPVLMLVTRSIGHIVAEQVFTGAERDEMDSAIVHDHSAIAEAIIAADGLLAEKLMGEHVRRIVEEFKSYWPMKIGEKVQWR